MGLKTQHKRNNLDIFLNWKLDVLSAHKTSICKFTGALSGWQITAYLMFYCWLYKYDKINLQVEMEKHQTLHDNGREDQTNIPGLFLVS